MSGGYGDDMSKTRSERQSVAVGERVRAFREDRGLSQAALAARMGVTQSHLSNLEAGLKTWTVDMMTAAADGLAVDARLLVPRRPHRSAPDTEQAAG